MGKLSVVINTLNEEKNIERAINSVKDIADEIVVVDMHSSDKTVLLAEKMGAKIFTHKKTGYVEPARNYAISKAKGKWVLVLDADEEAPKSLRSIVKQVIKEEKADYYRVPRKNIVFGKWIRHCGWWPDYNIRLFKKGFVSWNEVIHSVPLTQGKGAELEPKEENAITHHNYQSIDQYLTRLNRYTSIQASIMAEEGKDFFWKDIINKPANEFFFRYFRSEGYKDGVHGLALSLLQAFSELVVYLKLWELNKFSDEKLNIKEVEKEIGKTIKDLNYWKADSLFKTGGGIVNKMKRKFKLS